ncbi:MAG: [protein-PII] uridylyltransferase [Halofilum sp. (in: g-proteobacteria)]|nr:[protein-PII] uridylyltransferase [Halofilum sp. (in: g-proteobacteria)]
MALALSGTELPGLDTDAVDAALRDGVPAARAYARELAAVDDRLDGLIDDGAPAHEVVAARAGAVDALLAHAWARHFPEDADDIALVAVGGYGRGELQPHSDVDLLILLAPRAEGRHRDAIEVFLTLLWDAGLEIGQAVRTVKQCVKLARDDVTVATNLMESRCLCGAEALHAKMRAATGPNRIWPSDRFFRAKLEEQVERHRKFDNTAYRLEPNIKEGPGGLRDIQIVGWVAKRHFDTETLAGLVEHGFLTRDEYERLAAGQELLWRIRWCLHRIAGRREDRLLFDHQRELARRFGEDDRNPNRAVEALMQRYYRTVIELQRLNELLLQFLRETILVPVEQQPARALNERFQVRGEALEVAHARVFRDWPPALLEMFLLLARHREIRGIRPETLRRLRDDLAAVADDLRTHPEAHALFLELLREPERVPRQLFRMNRYGVLGAYLPAFDRIVGRMQYDLFHTYTVDEHTLRVIRNLMHFRSREEPERFGLCCDLMQQVDEPELLYLAALFHDIAKGRDGDHSELGAAEAEAFCRTHGLSSVQTGLISWLVRHHLLMSITAQRRDLSDPAVIHEFARTVSSIGHLNHLYLLTVADICATNPNLWNSFKDNLLQELYGKAMQALWRGLDNPIDKDERIAEVQAHARHLLADLNVPAGAIDGLWQELGETYFLRHNADEIAWHTRALIDHGDSEEALVLLRRETQRGSTELFVSRPDHRYRFALVTAVLERARLSVVDARILTSRSGRTMDTYLVLEANGEPIADDFRIEDIRGALTGALATPDRLPGPSGRRASRRQRHFDVPLRIESEQNEEQRVTAVEITASDRPGLLSSIARAFLDAGVRVHNARVATVGERIDDVFFVTDTDNRPLSESAIAELERAVEQHIGTQGSE